MTSSLNTVPYFTIRGLVNFLRQQGMTESLILNQLNCEQADLTNQYADFSTQDYLNLFEFAANYLKVSNLGFMHGKTLHLGEWGILGHIVMCSENLSQALEFQRRYQCLTSTFGHAYHEVNGNETTMRWLSDTNTPSQFTEQVITAWVAFAFSHTISEQKPKSIHFIHTCVGELAEYEAFFGCPVYFESQFNGVIIHSESLTLPLKNANKEILHVLCSNAEIQLSERKSMASLHLIRLFIIEQLPIKVPSLQDIAEHLGLSVRQVQRKFQKEQTNLTELLEQIRRDQAISYLTQTDHKLSYVAARLGYSEQSAFQRAFKRWTGQTPQAFRLHPDILIKAE